MNQSTYLSICSPFFEEEAKLRENDIVAYVKMYVFFQLNSLYLSMFY